MKDPIVNKDGSVEWQCKECGEPMLLFPSDAVAVVVGEHGDTGVLCERCANKRQPAKN